MNLYKITLTGYVSEQEYNKNRIAIEVFIDSLFIGEFWDMIMANSKPLPKIVADGVSDNIAFNISQHLKSLGCKIKIEPSTLTEVSQQEEKAQKYFDRANAPVLCPRCGSNQITTGQRGFSIVTGFIGSNKTVNRCAKCGYSWKP